MTDRGIQKQSTSEQNKVQSTERLFQMKKYGGLRVNHYIFVGVVGVGCFSV